MDLTPDELLTTTRAVRKRLDFSRPVEKRLIEECVAIALQAPNGGNRAPAHFVVVTEKEKREAMAEIFRKSAKPVLERVLASIQSGSGDAAADERERRQYESYAYHSEHFHEIPALVVPCVKGRSEGASVASQASRWGSVFPAMWSFMLAGRARGLGMTFTTIHLSHEEEAARVLGIPYREVMQAGMLPVAHFKGLRFRRAYRQPASELIHWEGW